MAPDAGDRAELMQAVGHANGVAKVLMKGKTLLCQSFDLRVSCINKCQGNCRDQRPGLQRSSHTSPLGQCLHQETQSLLSVTTIMPEWRQSHTQSQSPLDLARSLPLVCLRASTLQQRTEHRPQVLLFALQLSRPAGLLGSAQPGGNLLGERQEIRGVRETGCLQ